MSKSNLLQDTFVSFDGSDSKFSPVKYEMHELGLKARKFNGRKGVSLDMGMTF